MNGVVILRLYVALVASSSVLFAPFLATQTEAYLAGRSAKRPSRRMLILGFRVCGLAGVLLSLLSVLQR